jgi:hypothetical protein
LILAIKELQRLCPSRDWKFHYFGCHGHHVRQAAQAHAISERVVIHGTVGRQESLAAIAGAGAAAVVTTVYETGSLSDRGMITGKIFEPIGLGTPVLAIAPRGSDMEQVVKIAGGGDVFFGSETWRIAEYLAGLMNGEVPPFRNPEAFSWPSLIRLTDTILRRSAGISPAEGEEVPGARLQLGRALCLEPAAPSGIRP